MTVDFISPEPVVKLVNTFHQPFKNAVATARTCYSGKGIVSDENLTGDFAGLGKSIFQAGHHTTFQHAQFQFTLANVSRQFIWSFLHAHPYYNSEQVSQRYVEVKPGHYAIPGLGEPALKLYRQTAELQIEAYHHLVKLLLPVVSKYYFQRFSNREKSAADYQKDIQKKSQEIARYVLPVATFAYLYHTVSGITLMRYYRLCRQFDTSSEQQLVIGKMVAELLKVDPLYEQILQSPLELEDSVEYQYFQQRPGSSPQAYSREFINEFDASMAGWSSRLIDWKVNQEKVLADSVREVLGIPAAMMSDVDAIALALDPEKNPLLGETMNLTTHSKLTRCLFHASYTFRKKISHTADSQDQRHRMTPASRPVLSAHLSNTPDYMTPGLIELEPAALELYRTTMEASWTAITQLRQMGVSDENAMYLLPNAVNIRFTESADLLNLRHKHIMRLCYNAQEEIWRASMDEMQQITAVNPLIGKYLRPPCHQRYWAKVTPYCPEGERFCGVPVWTLEPDAFDRVL